MWLMWQLCPSLVTNFCLLITDQLIFGRLGALFPIFLFCFVQMVEINAWWVSLMTEIGGMFVLEILILFNPSVSNLLWLWFQSFSWLVSSIFHKLESPTQEERKKWQESKFYKSWGLLDKWTYSCIFMEKDLCFQTHPWSVFLVRRHELLPDLPNFHWIVHRQEIVKRSPISSSLEPLRESSSRP